CEFAVAQEGEALRSAADLTSFGDRVGLAEVEILRAVLFCVLLGLLFGQFDRVVKRPSMPQGNPLLERLAFPAGPSEHTAHAEPLELIVAHALHPVFRWWLESLLRGCLPCHQNCGSSPER